MATNRQVDIRSKTKEQQFRLYEAYYRAYVVCQLDGRTKAAQQNKRAADLIEEEAQFLLGEVLDVQQEIERTVKEMRQEVIAIVESVQGPTTVH